VSAELRAALLDALTRHRDDGVGHALDAHPEAVAAYVVTPSYFGAVSDVPGLAQVAHARGVLLIVDQAWAAHFGFHPDVPENAVRQGAFPRRFGRVAALLVGDRLR